jgi:hypothetical protein
MKSISILAVCLVSILSFAEGPAIGFGKERGSTANANPEIASQVDPIPEPTTSLDPIKMLLDDLRSKYEKNSALAIKPVAEGYLKKLEVLEKQLADKRRFEDAEIVKKYADYIRAKYVDMAMGVPPIPDTSKIKELMELEKQFAAYSANASKPVTEVYLKKLDAESVKCAKNKDYKNAKLFQDEIQNVKLIGNNDPACGKWQFICDRNVFFLIRPNGTCQTIYEKEDGPPQRWKRTGDILMFYKLDGSLVGPIRFSDKDTLTQFPLHDKNSFTFKRIK